MRKPLSRRISKRRRRVSSLTAPEQLETRRLLTSEISGVVFFDSNGDGANDAHEQGVTGALVTLTGTTTAGGDSITRRYLTQADGSYVFADLEPGTYAVTESQPASLADGLDRTDASGPTASNDKYSGIELTDDASVTGLNFGEGVIDAQYISPLWLLASSAKESFQRDMRATLEEEAGNTEFADAIRNGDTEIDSDLDLNVRPNAVADSYSVEAGETLTIAANAGVLTNDTDPTNDDMTAVLVEGPSDGDLTLNADGSFSYEPDTGFVGSDSFTYSANDGFKDSAPATVSIEVGNPNTFSVSESAIENDPVGTVEPLTNLGTDAVYEIVNGATNDAFRLVPDDHMSGTSDAAVVVIEYVDFACPACKAFHDGPVAQKLQLSPGDYLTVYRYRPLDNPSPQFQYNTEAAQAVEAASRQGLFTEMKGQLFDNQSEWTAATDVDAAIALFEQYGATISGFDLTQFRTDFDSQDVLDRIERDTAVARDLGINSTPSFVLDGVQQPGTLEATALDAAVGQAEQRPFKINRFTDDTDTAGELLVFNANAVTASSSPFAIDVLAQTNSGSETIKVVINVT